MITADTSDLMAVTPRRKSGYGYVPDLGDNRDYIFKSLRDAASLPQNVDLRDKMPPVYDQLQLSSCVGNSCAGSFEYELKKQGLRDFEPSRLEVYYNARLLEGATDQDNGAMIRDGIKGLVKWGACPETMWPYIESKVNDQPNKLCYAVAALHVALQYRRLTNSLHDMKSCLAADLPFVCGISVYESFESDEVANTGIVPMPQRNEQMIGGHAILVVGYLSNTKQFIVRNSWGANWGLKGYFLIPFEYLTNGNLMTDAWVISRVQ